MKTDDDAFVRVDEVLASLQRIGVTRGLLYGLINSDSHPHRNSDSKWYISVEVILYLIIFYLMIKCMVGNSSAIPMIKEYMFSTGHWK